MLENIENLAVEDPKYLTNDRVYLNDIDITDMANYLDMLNLYGRDLTRFNDPELNSVYASHIPFFYTAQALNACGTGTLDVKKEPTCGDIWVLFDRIWSDTPEWFEPITWSLLSFEEFEEVFNFSFVGKIMSQKDLWWRWMMLKSVGLRMMQKSWSWTKENIFSLPGFEQDPLKKKANLLIACLRYRPEKFVDFNPGPMIDYHIMRIFIRTGLLEMRDFSESKLIENEYIIRFFCYYIMEFLASYSRHDINTLDAFFWSLGKTTCCYQESACSVGCSCPLSKCCYKFFSRREPRIQTVNY